MNKRYVAFLVLTPFGIAAAVAAVALVTPADVSGSAQVAQAVIVGSAVVVGSTLAALRFGLFREFEPHVMVEHDVSHRLVGDSYVHVACSVKLRNTSRVAVRISRAEFSLHTTSYVSDEHVEYLQVLRSDVEPGGYFQWPPLDVFGREWSGEGLLIEPGSTTSEVAEFILSRKFGSLVVHSYFENRDRKPTTRGWYTTSFYDVIGSTTRYMNKGQESLR